MKQIVQNYNSGALQLADVPVPLCRPGGVLVRAAYSLVSAGTERMKVDQARMSLLAKARARPDQVRQVLQSVRQNGVVDTYRKVRERLDALTPLGYSLAGVVEEVGAGIDEFRVGDRVACAGEGIACHAEFVTVPRNLCAKVPDGVDLKDAAFGTVGAIALHGVRQAGVTIGDSVLVIGLGLVGLLAVQILKAAGCRVIGVDLDAHKLDLARACGADLVLNRMEPALVENVQEFTGHAGVDVAYVAAGANSADPLDLAGQVTRDRGRVVIVGQVRVAADWRAYYQKELSVVMSRSYGPGRYDPTYERKGIDYPVGYVRWTLRRNLAEFLRLVATGAVRPARLSPAVYPLAEAEAVYEGLHNGRHAAGLLFEYPPDAARTPRVELPHGKTNGRSRGAGPEPAGRGGSPASRVPGTNGVSRTVRVGLIGAGNFATGTLIPALKAAGDVRLRGVCSAGGLSATSAGQRHGFEYVASDYRELLADHDIDAVVIATRHDTHARFAAEALRAGKHVFVEKPLALTPEQLDEVVNAQQASGGILMVGFNRRFSPLSVAVRDFFTPHTGPLAVVCRVNAGPLKADSWYQDAEEGGWRIVSEGCHFVDLIQFLAGSPPVQVSAEMLGGATTGGPHDNCVVTLRLADGSLGTLVYLANGDPAFDKERIEVFGQGRAAAIENWHCARVFGGGRARKIKARGSGKGHRHEMAAFVDAIRTGGPSPLPLEQAVAATLATLAIQAALTAGGPVLVGGSSVTDPHDAGLGGPALLGECGRLAGDGEYGRPARA